jgi:hypothetical protein
MDGMGEYLESLAHITDPVELLKENLSGDVHAIKVLPDPEIGDCFLVFASVSDVKMAFLVYMDMKDFEQVNYEEAWSKYGSR